MAILKKVKAVMRTLVEISSVQEIPELKKYLMMTLTEIIMSWKAKKMHARMALIKWIALKIFFTFMEPHSSSADLSSNLSNLSSFFRDFPRLKVFHLFNEFTPDVRKGEDPGI
jgi:hypothetical protein